MLDPATRPRIGQVPLDPLTLDGAITRIVELVRQGAGGTVFTPNVDHVVVAEENPLFREAYAEVSVSLVDGTPVFWAGRMLGFGLPEKVSGSDLFEPLLGRAAEEGLSVYLLGGGPGVGELAKQRLLETYPGLKVVGLSSPRMSATGVLEEPEEILRAVVESGAQLVFVACGAPKSELFCHANRAALAPAVLVCVGAAIDFTAGTARRAPRWMSKVGLEWAYRLAREPRRLAHRYLVRDPKFLLILGRELGRGRGTAQRRKA